MAQSETHYSLPRPEFDAPVKLLIVVAPYYKDIADQLVAGAKAEIEAVGGTWDLVEVPGALEVPSAIALADRLSNFYRGRSFKMLWLCTGGNPSRMGFMVWNCCSRSSRCGLVVRRESRAWNICPEMPCGGWPKRGSGVSGWPKRRSKASLPRRRNPSGNFLTPTRWGVMPFL